MWESETWKHRSVGPGAEDSSAHLYAGDNTGKKRNRDVADDNVNIRRATTVQFGTILINDQVPWPAVWLYPVSDAINTVTLPTSSSIIVDGNCKVEWLTCTLHHFLSLTGRLHVPIVGPTGRSDDRTM